MAPRSVITTGLGQTVQCTVYREMTLTGITNAIAMMVESYATRIGLDPIAPRIASPGMTLGDIMIVSSRTGP